MLKRHARLLGPLVVVALVTAACGAGSKAGSTSPSSAGASSGGSSSSATATKTFKVGVLADLTGLEGSVNKTSVDGAKAAATLLAKQGITLDIVTADAATSPTAALAAAQELVTHDKVSAVVADSAVTFLVAKYLTQQGIPVIGYPSDGPEWLTSANMFSTIGALDSTKVTSLPGLYYKQQGATASGALGYSVAPQSAEQAKAYGVSAAAAGLKNAYTNANFPLGGTNVQPVALAMKQAGVDAVGSLTDQNTGLALLTALRQAGVTIKASLLAVGYGSDTLNAGAGAIQAAQGATFDTNFEPVEMNTAATKQFQQALAAVGVTGEPDFSDYLGYTGVLLLGQALKTVPQGASKADIIKALTGVTSFDAGGLLGSHPSNPNDRVENPGDVYCGYFSKLNGKTFVPVTGDLPLCGKVLTTTVSAG